LSAAPRRGPPQRSPAAPSSETTPNRLFKRHDAGGISAEIPPATIPTARFPCRIATTRDPTAVATRSSPRPEPPATASVQTPRNAEPEAADAGAAGGRNLAPPTPPPAPHPVGRSGPDSAPAYTSQRF
jgi:hypothetical protein